RRHRSHRSPRPNLEKRAHAPGHRRRNLLPRRALSRHNANSCLFRGLRRSPRSPRGPRSPRKRRRGSQNATIRIVIFDSVPCPQLLHFITRSSTCTKIACAFAPQREPTNVIRALGCDAELVSRSTLLAVLAPLAILATSRKIVYRARLRRRRMDHVATVRAARCIAGLGAPILLVGHGGP